MAKDPIVEEVRAARQKLFEACGEDLNALLDWFQEQENLDRERIVSDAAQVTRESESVRQRRAGSTRRSERDM